MAGTAQLQPDRSFKESVVIKLQQLVEAEGCQLLLSLFNDSTLTALAGRKLLRSQSITVCYRASAAEVCLQGLPSCLTRKNDNDQSTQDSRRSERWTEHLTVIAVEAIEARRFVDLVLDKRSPRICLILERALASSESSLRTPELARLAEEISGRGIRSSLMDRRALEGCVKQARDLLAPITRSVNISTAPATTKAGRRKQRRASQNSMSSEALGVVLDQARAILECVAEVASDELRQSLEATDLLDPSSAMEVVDQLSDAAAMQQESSPLLDALIEEWLASVYAKEISRARVDGPDSVRLSGHELDQAAAVLTRLKLSDQLQPSQLLFAAHSGSFLYNLEIESSDEDYVIVFTAPVERICSRTWEGAEALLAQHSGYAEDKSECVEFSAHEARSFAELVLKGSHWLQ